MFNINMEYMKSVGKIASESLATMAMIWEQMEFETEEPIEILCRDYPFDKSFDEVAAEFMFWVEGFSDYLTD